MKKVIIFSLFISSFVYAQNDHDVQRIDPQNEIQDDVIADDLIVQGSIGVGTGVVNGENFGFDTMRFKEDNLRIHFDDASTSASFPSNDWRITINDSGNGGDNYFSIDDATAGTVPFRVDAGAGNNALYVESGGNVGVGTSNPALHLQVTDGNTPGLRLEQDNSNGWGAQSWDVAANETNFFVRDVTNGSKLPFRIKPGAPTNSIFIDDSGSIGVGMQNPNHYTSMQLGSTTKGFLMNKLTSAQAATLAGNIGAGQEGMLIYNTELKGYYSWTGTEWKALAFVESASSSVPELLNYQAVVRDNSGTVVSNQTVSFKMDIHQTTETGTLVYSETHTATTSNLGLVNFKIGSGTIESGIFADIDWGLGNHYLKVSVDLAGGSSFTELGISQFVSVPYALRAKYADNVVSSTGNSRTANKDKRIEALEQEVQELKTMINQLLNKAN